MLKKIPDESKRSRLQSEKICEHIYTQRLLKSIDSYIQMLNKAIDKSEKLTSYWNACRRSEFCMILARAKSTENKIRDMLMSGHNIKKIRIFRSNRWNKCLTTFLNVQ